MWELMKDHFGNIRPFRKFLVINEIFNLKRRN